MKTALGVSPNKARMNLSARYAQTLRTYLHRSKQSNGDQAQGLGRAALMCGWGTLDLALLHDEAFARVITAKYPPSKRPQAIRRGDYFLAQALIPLESAERATRKSVHNLRRRNRTLREHAAALEE